MGRVNATRAGSAPVAAVLAVLGAIAIASLVTMIWAFARAGDGEVANGSTQGRFRGREPQMVVRLPDFELPSYRGGTVSADSLRRRVVLLTLLDTQCTDACPIIASVVADAIDGLSPTERAQVRAIGVTADPVEDTPASVGRFLRARGAEGRLDYLLGDERRLRPLWNALQVLPSLDSGRDSVHSAPVRIYDRSGVWVATLHAGADLNETNLIHDIRAALRARGNDTR